jgi:hypothetical protein
MTGLKPIRISKEEALLNFIRESSDLVHLTKVIQIRQQDDKTAYIIVEYANGSSNYFKLGGIYLEFVNNLYKKHEHKEIKLTKVLR